MTPRPARLLDIMINKGDKTDNEINNSSQKKCPSADLVCPITLELPIDPVTAEDGRVYEREAIQKHIDTQGRRLKSPMTNVPMKRRLFPAPQHKNIIETLVESGVLSGDLATRWKEQVNDKKVMEDLLKDAEKGNSSAMFSLGSAYFSGTKGLQKDSKLAYKWYKKAQEAGHVTAMAMVGGMLVNGKGVAKCRMRGVFYMTMASGKGSRFASWELAQWLAYGLHGMEVDKEEAIRMFQSVVEGKCAVNDIDPQRVKKARGQLGELMGGVFHC